jgi:hypothetical protein
MTSEIFFAGFPSRYGGADTELDHLIDLLRDHGVAVHLVPMFGADDEMQASVVARGCTIDSYRDDVFRDRVVASFCNGNFLERLPAIARAGRPRKVIWFNCMTNLFDLERRAHAAGLIDEFGFVSSFQETCLRPALEQIGPFSKLAYRPYFNVARVPWRHRPWEGEYRIGRVSRDDGSKFAADTWRIFDRVLVPASLQKKVYLLGYGPNAAARIGPAPTSLDWRTWAGNEIPSDELFRTIDTMIHKTGGSRESYCRVLIEAYAHGVVPIVERDYAFPELVVHGETGFMAATSDEMSHYASRLAFDPTEHRRLAENGRRHLETLVDRDACWAGWEALFRDGQSAGS